jgi:hypothetical protein
MSLKTTIPALLLCGVSAVSLATDGNGVRSDPEGDAVIRRTDDGSACIPYGFVPIDLLELSMQGWVPDVPAMDRYAGSVISTSADLLRLDLTLSGVVCPPGPIGEGFDPCLYGDRPLYGYVELDVDDDRDSGGELWPLAGSRYLANVGRFGLVPSNSISHRMVRDENDLNSSFSSGPQFERTGSEFTLAFCGCHDSVIVCEDGDQDSVFDAGETWIMRGRYFRRFEAFAPFSGLYGGSDFGQFDPEVELRFSHDPYADATTVTMVFPLTMAGAAMLLDEPEEWMDSDVGNHTSMQEALDDLIYYANSATGSVGVLVDEWDKGSLSDARRPREWDTMVLIGSAYPSKQSNGSPFFWTDTGFGEVFGDLNDDRVQNGADVLDIDMAISSDVSDAQNDGRVQVSNFGPCFNLMDLNYDGVIDQQDRHLVACPADLAPPFDTLDFFDVSRFLSLYGQNDQLADLVDDEVFNFFDVSAFLSYYTQPCPQTGVE